jgi:antitoxin component YwqK of YwqJK toxin-antitoxin module
MSDLETILDGLAAGAAHSEEEADWDFIGELVGVDFEEHDDYDYYIAGIIQPVVFIKGDVKVDGNAHTHDLAEGREGFEMDDDNWGVVVLGDVEISGNLSLDELAPLFVTGNLTCGAVTNAYGSLVVGGTIETGFVYLTTADEGGIVHATECKTPLFIDAGGTIDSDAPGDYRLLLANGYNQREKGVLRRALDALGYDDTRTTTEEVGDLGDSGDAERIAKFVELVEHFLNTNPEGVPGEAEWDESESAYLLFEQDDNGNPHGTHARWEPDGAVAFIHRYEHGEPNGEWTIKANNRLYTQHYVNGELQRPEGVPEGAVWLPDEWEWELSDTDDEGKKHGDVKWWRPDGTLVCVANYVHGLAQGEGYRFHESGEVSQSYTFVDDKLHGPRTFFSSDKPTTEQPVGPGIARAVFMYDMGTCTSATYYNAEDAEVDRWGNPV